MDTVIDPGEKSALINAVLERAADRLGDITPHVYARYYGAAPEARDHFSHWQPDDTARLEGEMVEQILFCLMELPEDRAEIEIIMLQAIPHHLETLKLPMTLLSGLVIAVRDTIADIIPAANAAERAAWDELNTELLDLVELGASNSILGEAIDTP